MIEKTIKTMQGKLKVAIPTLLTEVTLGQMIALQEHPELHDIDAISILSGVPVAELENIITVTDFLIFSDYVYALTEQIKHLYNSDAIPKRITFFLDRPVTVNVISNLSVEPAGAFMAARDIIAEEITRHIKQHGEEGWQETFNPSLRSCCQVLAHYFFCRVTGKLYNEYEAEEFCSEIKKLRVTEALPVAKHFFYCYPNLSKPRTDCWYRLLQLWKKRQAYRPLISLNTLTQ